VGSVELTIQGLYFGQDLDGVQVLWPSYQDQIPSSQCETTFFEPLAVNGTILDNTGASSYQVVCVTPPGVGSNFSFVVSSRVIANLTSKPRVLLSYLPPLISQLSGNVAVGTRGGSVLVVHGANFGPPGTDADILVGTQFCLGVTYFNDSVLSCELPVGSGLANLVQVRVGGQKSALNAQFSVSYAPPTISSVIRHFSTASTRGGDWLEIRGDNFGFFRADDQASAVVSIGPYNCSLSDAVVHDTINCTIPPGVGVNFPISVSVGGQVVVAENEFISYSPPAVDSVSYPFSPVSGLTKLAVFGSNFGPAAASPQVSLYDGVIPRPCISTEYVSHERLVCVVPVAVGHTAGLFVRVQVGGQISVPSNSTTFSYAPPVIDTISPLENMPTDGNWLLTIYGDQLGALIVPPIIKVGDNICRPLSLGSAQLVVCRTSPGVGSGLLATVDVGGQIAKAPFLLSFAPPVVDSFYNLSALSTSGGGRLVIMGSDLPPSAASQLAANVSQVVAPIVKIGSSVATIESYNSTQITVIAPMGVGKGLLVLVSAGNQQTVADQVFTFDPPEISEVVADSSQRDADGVIISPTQGGGHLLIRGRNFGTDPKLSFATVGGVSCSHWQILNDNQIDCTIPPGVGSNLTVQVQAGGQSSSSSLAVAKSV